MRIMFFSLDIIENTSKTLHSFPPFHFDRPNTHAVSHSDRNPNPDRCVECDVLDRLIWMCFFGVSFTFFHNNDD